MLDRSDLFAQAEAAGTRARPLESGFPVGALGVFSTGHAISGANYEDMRKTPVGSCAERAVLTHANNLFGPLSRDGGEDGHPIWEIMVVWGRTLKPISPCGLCRDALAGAGRPNGVILSRGVGGEVLELTIADLLPLAGRGERGDVTEEIAAMLLRAPGAISGDPDGPPMELLDRARTFAGSSWAPRWSQEPAAGAAIELEDGCILPGWFTMDATTRLGGSAITTAARRLLSGAQAPIQPVRRVALYTDAPVLRAPSGYDLQLLFEVAGPETPIIFGSAGAAPWITTVGALLPHGFGREI